MVAGPCQQASDRGANPSCSDNPDLHAKSATRQDLLLRHREDDPDRLLRLGVTEVAGQLTSQCNHRNSGPAVSHDAIQRRLFGSLTRAAASVNDNECAEPQVNACQRR